jgi:hypothetical protein
MVPGLANAARDHRHLGGHLARKADQPGGRGDDDDTAGALVRGTTGSTLSTLANRPEDIGLELSADLRFLEDHHPIV